MHRATQTARQASQRAQKSRLAAAGFATQYNELPCTQFATQIHRDRRSRAVEATLQRKPQRTPQSATIRTSRSAGGA